MLPQLETSLSISKRGSDSTEINCHSISFPAGEVMALGRGSLLHRRWSCLWLYNQQLLGLTGEENVHPSPSQSVPTVLRGTSCGFHRRKLSRLNIWASYLGFRSSIVADIVSVWENLDKCSLEAELVMLCGNHLGRLGPETLPTEWSDKR